MDNKNIPKNIEELANAIVVQACDDYRKAIRGLKIPSVPAGASVAAEVINFFNGEWFDACTKLDAKYILDRLNKEYEDGLKLISAAAHIKIKERNKHYYFTCPFCGNEHAEVYVIRERGKAIFGKREEKYKKKWKCNACDIHEEREAPAIEILEELY